MSNTPSLLPCPFCGGDARHDAHADDCYFILHSKLKHSGADMSTALEVLAAWNRRVAPAAMIGEPVFAFRRKGLNDFCTCTEERYAELSAKPNLFETRIFYTTPPAQAADGVLEDAALSFTIAHIDYVARYGGRCRDCADESGVCPGSGLPCANPRKAIKHVFDALEYGVKNGFIEPPNASRVLVEGGAERLEGDTP